MILVIIFSVCISFSSPCFASRWWEAGTAKANGNITYLDLDTITFYQNDMVTAWHKVIFKNKQNLITENVYIRGTKVNHSLVYTEYDCTNKMSRVLEETYYDDFSRFLNTYSNYSYSAFKKVIPESIGNSTLELVCKAKELELKGAEFYNFLAQVQSHPDQSMWELYIANLIDDFDRNFKDGISTLNNGNEEAASKLLEQAGISLRRSEKYAVNYLQNSKHLLLQAIYYRQLTISILAKDKFGIEKYSKLLDSFPNDSPVLSYWNSEIAKIFPFDSVSQKQVKNIKKHWWNKEVGL